MPSIPKHSPAKLKGHKPPGYQGSAEDHPGPFSLTITPVVYITKIGAFLGEYHTDMQAFPGRNLPNLRLVLSQRGKDNGIVLLAVEMLVPFGMWPDSLFV